MPGQKTRSGLLVASGAYLLRLCYFFVCEDRKPGSLANVFDGHTEQSLPFEGVTLFGETIHHFRLKGIAAGIERQDLHSYKCDGCVL